MKIMIAVLLVLIVLLQVQLWTGPGSIQQIIAYQQRLEGLRQEVQDRQERNQSLYAEVLDLRKGQEAIEERARNELGMVKPDETFFQVIE